MIDTKGIINHTRKNLNSYKKEFIIKTKNKDINDIINNVEIIIGLASSNILSINHIKKLKQKAIIFALSNPNPEINPYIIKKTRPDIIFATGRNDYKNQVNNAICFPYIFKSVLNLKIKHINNNIKKKTIHAIKNIARHVIEKKKHYKNINFGNKYIIPKIEDKRLKPEIQLAIENLHIKMLP